ncbi:hypothetical protein [Humibacillus xanthopallidus]|nr:hypothetical protein [Humibacillus xanthopallidus]
MTTSTLPTRATAPRVDSPVVAARAAVATDRVPQLALVAPLLLFTHGILVWVDTIGVPDPADPAEARGSVLAVVAGGILVLGVAGFASLAGTLASRSGRSELAVLVTLLGAFGAGAAAAVWALRSTGWLVDPLPSGLATGGAVVTALALGLALVVHTAEGRMPSGSLALAGAAGAMLALPLGLEPLGALVLLIALAPLTHSTREPQHTP